MTNSFDPRPLSEYGRLIGKGGFGEVFLGNFFSFVSLMKVCLLYLLPSAASPRQIKNISIKKVLFIF